MFASALPDKRKVLRDRKIRVLVVDDSVVIRRLVTHALSAEEGIEVVSAASNGAIALQRISQFTPDVVTLDIEMPELDGLETLRRIRRSHPELPVIMFSTLTERGAAITLEALTLGASDYVTKAANAGSLDNSMISLRSELVPKLKQFFYSGSDARPVSPPPTVPSTQAPVIVKPGQRSSSVRPQVVVIGTSTGGPNALAALLPMFPKDFGIPILIVQHMPPVFTRFLAERLNSISAIRVEEVSNGTRLESGKALVAAGGFHMRLHREGSGVVATTDQEPPENSCRPAVDVLFRSAADVYGPAVMAIMLTGMGNDGLRGTEILHRKGAYVIAQDEDSSVVWGMPGCIANAGLAHATLDLSRIVPEILAHT
jgi:two-component system chemotaxis response regulator CheB